ncbi:hypothetical protein QWZ08_14060 [Ferruginibacter paludis]|uniref:hypothetical protein n=1 Tax=Ferruginibacter paludis TaxID=1310417 RepID=UPI0025B3D195|nr:hypothetical protein [Ferruginibacter paludis]MDN3656766.1 hypothetical protein [Ferruginibacter paludis]
MLNTLKQLFRNNYKTAPDVPVLNAAAMHHAESFDMLVKNLNTYFANHPERNIYAKELAFLNSGFKADPGIDKINYAIFPYDFILGYDYRAIPVYFDETAAMFFVYLDGKKLYYHKGYTNAADVQKSFTFLLAEQHPDSPHCYLGKDLQLGSNEVVADLGAAEGNFSLLVVDQVKELIIVEADTSWIEALHKTFEPWKDKVRIIGKSAGCINDEKTITLNKLEEGNAITFVKMDIEGSETSVINYAESYIGSHHLKLAVTTYHGYEDAGVIKSILERNDYHTWFSDGYMLFISDDLTPPYFRKTLVKAYK